MTPIDLFGLAAALLVFATFCARTMHKLRLLAIASNVAFILYALPEGLWPILILHGALLPMNLWQYAQVWQRRREPGDDNDARRDRRASYPLPPPFRRPASGVRRFPPTRNIPPESLRR